MIHSFDADVAIALGVKGAILLHHIGWWVEKNRANGTNYHDGRYWTYNSADAFTKIFPFWSMKTIQRELKALENADVIKSARYNTNPFDKTKWFTLTQKGAELLKIHCESCPDGLDKNDQSHWTKMSNGLDGSDFSTIIQYKTNSIKHSIPRTSKEDCSPALAETLKAFEEHRKKMRKPMTDYAKKLLLKKLEKLASDEEGKIAILNQSIENGWQGIFPLKGTDNAGESSAEMAERVKQKLRERGFLNDGAGENNGNGDANSRPSWFS